MRCRSLEPSCCWSAVARSPGEPVASFGTRLTQTVNCPLSPCTPPLNGVTALRLVVPPVSAVAPPVAAPAVDPVPDADDAAEAPAEAPADELDGVTTDVAVIGVRQPVTSDEMRASRARARVLSSTCSRPA